MKYLKLIAPALLAALLAGLIFLPGRDRGEPALPEGDRVDLPVVDIPAAEAPAVTVPGLADLPVRQAMPVGDSGPIAIEVTPLQGGEERIQVTTPGFVVSKLDEVQVVAGLLDGQPGSNRGEPDLPMVVRLIEGREGYLPRVRIEASTFEDHEDYEIAPTEGFHPDGEEDYVTDRRPDEALYQQNAYWPEEIASVNQFRVGGKNMVRVAYRPLQYNPVTKTLRHHRDIDSVVSFVKDEAAKVAFASSATEVLDDCDCSERTTLGKDLLPPMNNYPSDFASRWSGQESAACVKVTITKQGVHRITGSVLTSAGVSASDLVGANIRMYTRDREIPIHVSTAGSLGAGGYIEFYGEGLQGFYSDENAYWIGFGGPGSPMRLNDGAHQVSVSATINGNTPISSACRQSTLDLENDWQGAQNYADEEFDGYISAHIVRNPFGNDERFTYRFPQTDQIVSSVNPTMEIYLRNKTLTPDQHEAVNASNGQLLGAVSLLAKESGLKTITFPASRLTSSALGTSVEFRGENSGGVFVYDHFVDFARLKFERRFVGIGSRLGFGGKAGAQNYRVQSIGGTGTPWLLDISDPTNPKRLVNFQKVGTTVNFGYNSATAPCFYTCANTSFESVVGSQVETVTIENLADPTRQTDYIVIAPDAFLGNTLYQLLDHRASDLNVLVTSLDSIYNEFGYGVKHADAIRQFLGYAYHHFQEPKPRYVLLMGDGTKDPKQVNLSQVDWIPAKFQRTSFLYTAVDQWYVDVDGRDSLGKSDTLPDMAIGRLPANSVSDIQNFINKTKTYEAYGLPSWRRNIRLVADEPEAPCPDPSSGLTYPVGCVGYDRIQEELDNNVLPGSYPTVRDFLSVGGGNVNSLNDGLVGAINSGVGIVNYIGHGSASKWGLKIYSEAMFDSKDITGDNGSGVPPLNNTRLTLVSVFTCSNGIFYQPDARDCCAEQFLWRPGQGAAGVVAPTGLAQTRVSRRLSIEFYNAMINDRLVDGDCGKGFTYINASAAAGNVPSRVGDCMLNAFRAVCYDIGNASELKFYALFMDPAAKHGY